MRARESGLLPQTMNPEALVALDVGSDRVACALAEIDLGRPRLVAVEASSSYGIRGGAVVDLERAAETIRG
ncbi:MAG: hypothetical protein M5U26_04065 [Planctomycetota bacterium]|nr:hypothetical protein [Planctomycetota bacterium]